MSSLLPLQSHLKEQIEMVYDLISTCCGPSDPSISTNESTKSRGWLSGGLFGNKNAENSAFAVSMEMLSGANLIYTFAELRDLARNGATNSSIEELNAPMTAEKMVEVISLNKDALIATGNYQNLDATLASLQSTHIQRQGMPRLVEFVDDRGKLLLHCICYNLRI